MSAPLWWDAAESEDTQVAWENSKLCNCGMRYGGTYESHLEDGCLLEYLKEERDVANAQEDIRRGELW